MFHQNLRTGVKGKGALREQCGSSNVYDGLKTGKKKKKKNQTCSAVFLLAVLVCGNNFFLALDCILLFSLLTWYASG